MTAIIEMQNVSLGYDGTTVLSEISCAFERKEIICVVGKNGSGKSTLLRAAAGLAPYSGSITLAGAEIRSFSRRERAKRLSYLPQFRPIPAMDVETLITHGRFPYLGFTKTPAKKDREKILNAASAAGVQHLLTRDLYSLSGGERQRTYIAMTLAQDAEVIFLDEPTTHLDIEHQLEIMALLKALGESGKCVIMAAHDLPQAFSYATKILLVGGGSVAVGSPDDFCDGNTLEGSLGVAVKKDTAAGSIYSYRIAVRS